MEKKVKLLVLGFSFNQTQSGTYGLVLAEEGGKRRLMIVVGTPEAQSIAFKLHNSQPPRPLTHDLFYEFMFRFEIDLLEVNIYKYEDGVFFSKMILRQHEEVIQIESRTSDAVSIALRAKAPIYTTESIMERLSVTFDENAKKENQQKEEHFTPDYSLLYPEELEALLKDAIDGEDYELASLLRDELAKKRNQKH